MGLSARGTLDARWRVRKKAGVNREILSARFGMAHSTIAYKAEEAGTPLHLGDARQRKPSQQCEVRRAILPKPLSELTHVCPHCGLVMPCDQNSTPVVRIDTQAARRIRRGDAPGTGGRRSPNPCGRNGVSPGP
ncbi:MAG: transposase [Betaproteobacteria bacterium]|nr:transposase [Betaproteobacteria bacterium]